MNTRCMFPETQCEARRRPRRRHRARVARLSRIDLRILSATRRSFRSATPQISHLLAFGDDAVEVVCALIEFESTDAHALEKFGHIEMGDGFPNVGHRECAFRKPACIERLWGVWSGKRHDVEIGNEHQVNLIYARYTGGCEGQQPFDVQLDTDLFPSLADCRRFQRFVRFDESARGRPSSDVGGDSAFHQQKVRLREDERLHQYCRSVRFLFRPAHAVSDTILAASTRFDGSIFEGVINQVAQQGPVTGAFSQIKLLHHEYRNQTLLRIDPKVSAQGTGPEKIAHRSGYGTETRSNAHSDTQTVALPKFRKGRGNTEIPGVRAEGDVGRQLVAAQQLDALAG
jgi:hypothetical protein